jgi:hypothetical protein
LKKDIPQIHCSIFGADEEIKSSEQVSLHDHFEKLTPVDNFSQYEPKTPDLKEFMDQGHNIQVSRSQMTRAISSETPGA